MNKGVLKGSLILIASGLMCKFLGACFRLPLTNFLGVEGIGVFQLVMSLYAFALVFCSSGMSVFMSKKVAEFRACQNYNKISSVCKQGFLWAILTGGVVGLFFLFLSSQISVLQSCVECCLSYRILIFLLPVGSIVACFRGVLQGYEEMNPTAISQIIEQFLRLFFGLMFAFLFVKKGVEWGVFGTFLGLLVAEVFAFLYLYVCIRKKRIVFKNNYYTGFAKGVIPLTLGGCVFPFIVAVESFFILNRLTTAGFSQSQATALFGLSTGVVGAILNFPLIISTSIALAILPSLSYLKETNKQEMQKKINQSFLILTLVVFPAVLGVTSVCEQLYQVVYPTLNAQMLNYAINLTKLGAVSTLLCAYMQFFVAILQSQGSFVYSMLLQLVAGGVKLFLTFVLCGIVDVNIFGLTFSNIIMFSLVLTGCLVVLGESLQVFDFNFLVPVFSSIIMFFTVNFFIERVSMSPVLTLLCSAVLGVFVYFSLVMPVVVKYFRDFFVRFAKKQQKAE